MATVDELLCNTLCSDVKFVSDLVSDLEVTSFSSEYNSRWNSDLKWLAVSIAAAVLVIAILWFISLYFRRKKSNKNRTY